MLTNKWITIREQAKNAVCNIKIPFSGPLKSVESIEPLLNNNSNIILSIDSQKRITEVTFTTDFLVFLNPLCHKDEILSYDSLGCLGIYFSNLTARSKLHAYGLIFLFSDYDHTCLIGIQYLDLKKYNPRQYNLNHPKLIFTYMNSHNEFDFAQIILPVKKSPVAEEDLQHQYLLKEDLAISIFFDTSKTIRLIKLNDYDEAYFFKNISHLSNEESFEYILDSAIKIKQFHTTFKGPLPYSVVFDTSKTFIKVQKLGMTFFIHVDKVNHNFSLLGFSYDDLEKYDVFTFF